MTEEQRTRLEGMSRKGQPVTFKIKGGGGWEVVGIVEDEVYEMVSDYKHMIQRVRLSNAVDWGSEYAYRTGYYTYDAHMVHIKWGQYTQFLAEHTYRALLAKAHAKGWELF